MPDEILLSDTASHPARE